jgi:small-conductance mechanosensitive channel
VRGEIVRMDGAATTLKTGDGTIRIPNSILVERIVVVESGEPPSM